MDKQPIQLVQGKQVFFNTLKWGFILWLIGYVLGFVFFAFVPANLIGWAIMPIGVAVTLWVLFKKINREKFQCYVGLAAIWTLMAIILDYLFIVKLLQPAGSYYKTDVYLYYILTFLLPIAVGWWKLKRRSN
jgi:membrane protein DedA with SNARE-associated domain